MVASLETHSFLTVGSATVPLSSALAYPSRALERSSSLSEDGVGTPSKSSKVFPEASRFENPRFEKKSPICPDFKRASSRALTLLSYSGVPSIYSSSYMLAGAFIDPPRIDLSIIGTSSEIPSASDADAIAKDSFIVPSGFKLLLGGLY